MSSPKLLPSQRFERKEGYRSELFLELAVSERTRGDCRDVRKTVSRNQAKEIAVAAQSYNKNNSSERRKVRERERERERHTKTLSTEVMTK